MANDSYWLTALRIRQQPYPRGARQPAFNLRSRIAWSWIGVAVMSPFNVLGLGIGLVLTCFGITTVREEHQIGQSSKLTRPLTNLNSGQSDTTAARKAVSLRLTLRTEPRFGLGLMLATQIFLLTLRSPIRIGGPWNLGCARQLAVAAPQTMQNGV